MRTPTCSLKVVSRLALAAAPLTLMASPAWAHVAKGIQGGFESGFIHPVLGLDHLLAMLAVGIWGAQMGGRAVWTLPVTFPMIMALGGLIGMSGFELPHVETGIGLSVLVLGLAIAAAWRAPEVIALPIVAAFAIFHGFAHGQELPNAVDPASYAVGFVVATGAIHVVGIAIGLFVKSMANGLIARAAGAAIAAAGVYFLTA